MAAVAKPGAEPDIVAELKSAYAAYQTDVQQKKEARRVIIKACGKNSIVSLYFIQGESGFIEIGQSENPKARLDALQQGNIETLALLKVIPPGPTRLTEHQMHQKFKHHRVRGERFRPAPELPDFILGVCDEV